MSVRAGANALECSTKFVGAVLIPYGMEFGMITNLAIFKGLAGFFIEDRKGPFGEKSIRVGESGGRIGSDYVDAVDTGVSARGNR